MHFWSCQNFKGEIKGAGSNGSRQITVYWKELLLRSRGHVCADTFREINKVAV